MGVAPIAFVFETWDDPWLVIMLWYSAWQGYQKLQFSFHGFLHRGNVWLVVFWMMLRLSKLIFEVQEKKSRCLKVRFPFSVLIECAIICELSLKEFLSLLGNFFFQFTSTVVHWSILACLPHGLWMSNVLISVSLFLLAVFGFFVVCCYSTVILNLVWFVWLFPFFQIQILYPII